MNEINKNAAGLTVGGFFVLYHLAWLILVGTGLATPLIDFVLTLHHISFTYSISPLSLIPAIILLVFVFVVGYIIGWVFAALWNKFKR